MVVLKKTTKCALILFSSHDGDFYLTVYIFAHLFPFQGIVRAIKDNQEPLKEHEVKIFVRRGGPNYQEGLRVMGEVGELLLNLGISD